MPYLFTRSAFLYMMFKTHGFSLLFAGEALGSCISGGYKNFVGLMSTVHSMQSCMYPRSLLGVIV